MALASLDIVKKRVIQILNANPEAFAATVDGEIGSFPFDAEISEAIFEAESLIVTEGYLQSVNPTLSGQFSTIGDPMQSGSVLPYTRGSNYAVELSTNGADWQKGIEAAHIDDITNAIRFGNYVEPNAFSLLYKFDAGRFYTTASVGRIKTLAYNRTSALQINQTEQFLLIATTVRLLTKNASPAPFAIYATESARGIQALVIDGQYSAAAEVSN